MDYNAAQNFFGVDYSGSVPESVGTFTVKANAQPLDISYRLGGQEMSILPPGGYIIKYIEGSFLIMKKAPTFLAIGGENGFQVSWMCSRSRSWSTVPFNIDYEAADAKELRRSINPTHVNSILQMEFTRPHRLQLIAPEKAAGEVKVKIIRYASRYLLHPTEEQLIQEAIHEPVPDKSG